MKEKRRCAVLKKTIFVLGLSSLLVTVACSNQEEIPNSETNEQQSVQENKSNEENETNEEVPSLTEEQAVKLLNDTIDTIVQILAAYAFTEDGNIAYSGEPDYEYLQKTIAPYVAATFFDSNMDLLQGWFEHIDSDARVLPFFNEEVRFDMEQNAENIHIETIGFGYEGYPVGDALEFKLHYADGSWKLADFVWKPVSEFPLSQEEALVVVNHYEGGFSFNRELLVNGEKSYEFINGENSIATVNAFTAYVVYDSDESIEYTTETQTPADPAVELINNFSKPTISKSSGLNNKNYYSKQVSAIEAYLDSITDVMDGSGMGSYLYMNTAYVLWDNLLNEVWADLRANLDTASFNSLKSEQLNWISDKEAKSKEAEAQGGGGLWQVVAYNEMSYTMTEERCRQLINKYIK